MEELSAGFVDPFIGMRAEIVTLCLNQSCRQDFRPTGIVTGQYAAESGIGMPYSTAIATILRQAI